MKETMEHLLGIIQYCDLSSDAYRNYLNTGLKKYWSEFFREHFFHYNICKLHDEDLLDSRYDSTLVKAVETHDQIREIAEYPKKSEEILSILHQIKKIMLPLTLTHLKEYKGDFKELKYIEYFKEEYLKKLDQQFYSLLQS